MTLHPFASRFITQVCAEYLLGSESRSTAPSFRQTLVKHREALKVFLKFLKTFSSEKVFKPPEALTAKPCYSARSAAMRQRALKGFRGKQEFSPNDFGGSTPPKSRECGEKQFSFDCCGAVKRAKSEGNASENSPRKNFRKRSPRFWRLDAAKIAPRRAVTEKGFLQTRRNLAPFTKQAVGTPADFVNFCAPVTYCHLRN